MFTRPLAGVLWGLFQAPIVQIPFPDRSCRILSYTADWDFKAKGLPILRIDPIAVFVGDPSTKDELIARRGHSMISHSVSPPIVRIRQKLPTLARSE